MLFAKKFKKSISLIFGKYLLLCLMTGSVASALAVTDAEMEQARAIAAKYYLRNMRDGSGYLDDVKPTSMSDLENQLQADEKRNVEAFKNASYSKDYASWDKEQLKTYWSQTFFNDNSGLSKEGSKEYARAQIKKAINNMTVSAPSVAQASPPADPAPAAPVSPDYTSAEEASENALDAVMAQEAANQQAAQQEVAQVEESSTKGESKGSGTWVYIMVLGILVAIVIVLVIYASRTMKGGQKSQKEKAVTSDGDRHAAYAPKPVKRQEERKASVKEEKEEKKEVSKAIAEETRMREKYAENLAAKVEEIGSLNRQLRESEATVGRLQDENRRLKAEIERLRHAASIAPVSEKTPLESHRENRVAEKTNHEPEPAKKETKEVYLGRVNNRGLFVRADRNEVEGHSIYKLSTANGISGTFTVVESPVTVAQMLEDPGKWLACGCFAKDIFDTDGRKGVRTLTSGTAVFKDGAWRVEKKAKIEYL